MSLDHVPLTVRLGNTHITREVAAVGFRKEAVGGVRNIRLRLARPLDRTDQVTAYTRVYLYDARTAETIAEGRLSDLGRSADASSGQQWDLVAFGPLQHASDKTVPLIYVDRQMDRWRRGVNSTPNATTDTGEIDEDTPTLEVRAEEGKFINGTSWKGDWNYRAIRDAGMFLARVRVDMDAGVSDANYRQQICTRINSGTVTVARDIAASTTSSVRGAEIVTDFANGHDVVTLRALRQTADITGVETHWFSFANAIVHARRKAADGTDITTGYSVNTVTAADVVKDLLGRVLDQYDGAGAIVAAGSNTIDQLAYPDGVTPAQVLDDMMALEPALYWTTGPSDPVTGKYPFEWKAWPTTVRYEVTLEDGGSFPASSQELYNQVVVRWANAQGRIRQVPLTGACPILDAAGVVRKAIIDLGDEIGSAANATIVGNAFLAEHKYPANAGTLAISRPIRDLTTGAMVEPFEIEPGELIRLRGVESYPDALNASSNDGQTVFRIWTMEYDSDSDTAQLELDTWSRTEANAISRLITRRNRKR